MIVKVTIIIELGLYYKHTTIVKYASSIINKLEVLLTDGARVIIYVHHVSIVHATELGLYYKNMTISMSDACAINVLFYDEFRSINDTSRVVRMTIVSDALSCGIIVTTLELSFTIIKLL
jgi:hypothetical protein